MTISPFPCVDQNLLNLFINGDQISSYSIFIDFIRVISVYFHWIFETAVHLTKSPDIFAPPFQTPTCVKVRSHFHQPPFFPHFEPTVSWISALMVDRTYLYSKLSSSIIFLAKLVYFSDATGHGNALDQNPAFVQPFSMRILILTCLQYLPRKVGPLFTWQNGLEAGLGPGTVIRRKVEYMTRIHRLVSILDRVEGHSQ